MNSSTSIDVRISTGSADCNWLCIPNRFGTIGHQVNTDTQRQQRDACSKANVSSTTDCKVGTQLLDDDVPRRPPAGDHRQHVLLVRADDVQQERSVVLDHCVHRVGKVRLAADVGGTDAVTFRDLDEVGIGLLVERTRPLSQPFRVVDRKQIVEKRGETTDGKKSK